MDTRDIPAARSTQFVHTGQERDPHTGAMVPPIYRAVSYHHEDPAHPGRWDYARSGNPTRDALEEALAHLEGGVRGLAFSSGNQAITTVLSLLSHGDHVIVTRDCQGGTQRLLRVVFQRFGIDATYVDTDDLAAVNEARRRHTRALLVENFSNPFLRVSDIAALAHWAHGVGLWVAVDNTFLTPYLQNPLTLGADIVIHSATKMLSGHGDVTAGVAVAREGDMAQRLYAIQNAVGSALSPDDSYTVLRGIHTLPLRMERSMDSAGHLARWLQGHPAIAEVYYPGLVHHPGHGTARTMARGFGSMVTVRLRDPAWTFPFARHLRRVAVGAGFGSTETAVSLPELHCHAALLPEERQARGIGSDLLRFSVGLEDWEDIRADIEDALDAAQPSNSR